MLASILALIPTKDWFYGALIASLGLLGWHFYDKYEDAIKYAATVKAESVATLADAKKTIADQTASYSANLQKVLDNDAKIAAANITANSADLDSLRRIAALNSSNPVLQGASGTAAEAAAWASRLGQVESISADLANALRNDDLAVSECRAERDSLTGK